jgi:tetratricopeptide (TPR) repeat protein
MTRAHDSAERPPQQSLAELFTQYLRQQTAAQAEGLGYAAASEEVVPYDATPAQPIDPRLAWEDAQAALRYLASGPAPALEVPPEWPNLVAAQDPAVAVPFCLGDYPQMVRHLHALLAAEPSALRVAPTRTLPAPALAGWARRTPAAPQALLAAGVLRLAGQLDEAQAVLAAAEVPACWQALRDNEAAALSWYYGRTEEALRSWQNQADSTPVLFNRGLAALFLGRTQEASAALTAAVDQLPETSAWHHLGQLYLALASGGR